MFDSVYTAEAQSNLRRTFRREQRNIFIEVAILIVGSLIASMVGRIKPLGYSLLNIGCFILAYWFVKAAFSLKRYRSDVQVQKELHREWERMRLDAKHREPCPDCSCADCPPTGHATPCSFCGCGTTSESVAVPRYSEHLG